MKTLVNNIAALAAKFLGRDDLATIIESVVDETEFTIPPEAELLITSVGITCQELAEERFPIEATETVRSDMDCCLQFDDFESRPHRVLAVKEQNGRFCTFRNFPEFVKVSKPRTYYYVTFEKIPDLVAINEEVEHSARLSERVLAYGTCSHFCLCSLVLDEAKLWNTRYKDALEEIRMKYSSAGNKKVASTWKI